MILTELILFGVLKQRNHTLLFLQQVKELNEVIINLNMILNL
jgi:hypothetical protein